MVDDANQISRERSPKFPALNLSDSLDHLQKLFKEVGRSTVDSATAVKALGYSGLSGASKSVMAALSGYGLIQREGVMYKISDLGVRVIRPLNEDDKLASLRIAFMTAPVFVQIGANHGDCSEAVLANILLREGFTDDGAKRAARVYKENVVFTAYQDEESIVDGASDKESEVAAGQAKVATTIGTPTLQPTAHTSVDLSRNVLATFRVPFAQSEAEIIFSGTRIEPEDFDALTDYVAIFKRQYERKMKTEVLPLSKAAVLVADILAGSKKHLTIDEAAQAVFFTRPDLRPDFLFAWNELLQTRKLVVVDSRDPKIYCLGDV